MRRCAGAAADASAQQCAGSRSSRRLPLAFEPTSRRGGLAGRRANISAYSSDVPLPGRTTEPKYFRAAPLAASSRPGEERPPMLARRSWAAFHSPAPTTERSDIP